MTTSATHDATTQSQHDDRTRKAWGTYRENLLVLDGPAYDEAERAEWEHLQTELREIAQDRSAARLAAERAAAG